MLDSSSALETSAEPVERARVLVVDDEPQVLLAMDDLLCDEFIVMTAGTGEQALELIRSHPDVAVVISDQRMPAMAGDQLLEKVSRISRATRILFTGFADLTSVIRAVNRGRIFAYVTKPWNADNVMSTVRQGVEQYVLANELAYERQLLADLMSSAPDAIYFKDRELRYVRVNRAFAELYGRVDPASIHGLRLGDLAKQLPADVVKIEDDQRAIMGGAPPNVDMVSRMERDGLARWISTTNAPIRGNDGEILGLVGISRDITERVDKEAEIARQAKQLTFLAQYDELTHLPKRQLLLDRIAQKLRSSGHGGGAMALLLIDIDRFHRINVSLGRSAGDELLKTVSDRLHPLMAADDTLARFDNNTFAWLMDGPVSVPAVSDKVDRLLLPRLRAPFNLNGSELRVSCRIGVVFGPADGQEPETLLRNAEAALQRARVTGESYTFYLPSMNERLAERLALETKLRRAIELEEFVLHYQPKVELKSGLVVGLEALIRWEDPEHGLVAPASFIPLLEETGLILDVGRWVFRRAAEQFTEWSHAGLAPPPIAVNVSSLELAHSDFLRAIDQTSSTYPLALGGVELEITESVLMDDLSGNIAKLQACREQGLRVAIDDFGTGYSSLGYLSRLPIDALKVDRSFVMRMADDPHDMTIVMTIISLAHALDLKVIAEGPETMHQAQLLRLLRCDQIQGYLVSRPIPAEQIIKMLGGKMRFDSTGPNPGVTQQ